MKIAVLTALLSFTVQQSKDVEFFLNGKFYEFTLPGDDYAVSNEKYTDGTYTTYEFKSGEIIVLHVGYNVLKPFLTEKWNKVTDIKKTEFGTTRIGYDKRTKLFWQEDINSDESITLYFANVSQDKLSQFQECLGSLRVVRAIR